MQHTIVTNRIKDVEGRNLLKNVAIGICAITSGVGCLTIIGLVLLFTDFIAL